MEIVIYANSKETQSLAKNSCRQKCLHKSLATVFPFTPPNSPKNENFKTMTKRPVPEIICYTVPEIWHLSDVIVIFRFG